MASLYYIVAYLSYHLCYFNHSIIELHNGYMYLLFQTLHLVNTHLYMYLIQL